MSTLVQINILDYRMNNVYIYNLSYSYTIVNKAIIDVYSIHPNFKLKFSHSILRAVDS